MPDEKRKMAFYEIGKIRQDGNYFYPLAEELQQSFESIQMKAEASGIACSLSLKITAQPRNGNDRFGKIQYELKETNPVKKSVQFTTELNQDGIVIDTGSCALDIDQLDLEFRSAQIHSIKNEGKKK